MIRRARHRYILHLLVHQMFFALTVAMAGCILLLLLGTQIFNGAWLLAVFCGSFAWGLYRARARFRTPYQIAQDLDRSLQLHDRLSTAQYFSEHSDSKRGARELIDQQRASAEAAARNADLKAGLPFILPRSMYASTALAAVALSVFAVRYGVTRSLDLRPSLVQIAFNGILGSEDTSAAKKKKGGPKGVESRLKEPALGVDPWESKTIDQEGAPDAALNTVDTPDVNNPNYNTEANAKANGAQSKDPQEQQGEANGENEKTPSGSDKMAENASAPDKEGGREGKQQAGQDNKQDPNSSGENSSLTDKMRDALSNLMSKLKMQQKPGDGKAGPQSQQGAQSAQKQGKDEKGTPQAGKQSDSSASQDQQGDQDGQSSEKAASAQNKSGSKSSDKTPSQDGKSGVGKEDGDKSAREAEQLAAMGKITEIIGKRAANMTGEVMVEVASGKQQLKTQYSQHKAAHEDAGGEINRDEVPLAYQQFVQQYFEEIRKTPAKPKKNSGT